MEQVIDPIPCIVDNFVVREELYYTNTLPFYPAERTDVRDKLCDKVVPFLRDNYRVGLRPRTSVTAPDFWKYLNTHLVLGGRF